MTSKDESCWAAISIVPVGHGFMRSVDRWKRVQELFDLLEPLPGDRRVEELARVESNAEVRSDVMRLFAAIRGEEQAQEAAQQAMGAARDKAAAGAPSPLDVGWESGQPDLKLISLIGSGGSGSVFEGLRTVNGVEQKVAVKIYHAHRSAPADLDRFVREQRMLATLTDPGIVRFFDAGLLPDGRPYLVMELAEGAHITRHCDEHHLGVEARLRLLLAVCRAVASAHARLIVHLDLKPSNILVTPDGDVKLLDFGTARWIDHSLASVVTEQLTPQYASPERLRGEAATVSSDVYSLGMILFELCSGGSPFPKQTSLVGMAERAGGHTTATRPAEAVTSASAAQRGTTLEKLRRQLHGDIASICAKALAFDAGQRYGTVSELADDLRRYLGREPVAAHAASFGYRTSKFVVRYWGRLALAAAVSVGLVGAALYSWMQARKASIALERAEAAQMFLSNVLSSGSYRSNGAGPTVPQLLELAESRVAGLRGQDKALASDIELALGLARQPEDRLALESAQRALELARASGDVTREASALAVLGNRNYLINRPEEAWELLRMSLELWNRHRSEFSPARSVWLLGVTGRNMTYVRPFDLSVREPLAACLQLTKESQRIPPYMRQECLVAQAVSYLYGTQEYAEALPLLLEAVELHRIKPSQPGALAESLQLLGLTYRFLGRYREEEQALRESYQLAVESAGAESLAAANARAVWAVSLGGTGRAEEGLRQAVEALAVYRRLFPQRAALLLYSPLSAAMVTACLSGRYADCELYSREALESLGGKPSARDSRVWSAKSHLGLALAHVGHANGDAKRLAEARPLLENAIQMSGDLKLAAPHQRALQKAMEEALGQIVSRNRE